MPIFDFFFLRFSILNQIIDYLLFWATLTCSIVVTFCSVDGFRALVERYLDVEVTGLDRNGAPIKITASGWQARILQHECDHLDGTLYVDKMVPRTFRTVENLDLPLARGCPKQGPR